jgi:hypothetical protein
MGYMETESDLEIEVSLALANAKRLQRDARAVVGDIARIRDSIQSQNVQSRKDTTT